MTSWHTHGHINTHKNIQLQHPPPPLLTHTMLYLAILMTGHTFSPAPEQLRLWECVCRMRLRRSFKVMDGTKIKNIWWETFALSKDIKKSLNKFQEWLSAANRCAMSLIKKKSMCASWDLPSGLTQWLRFYQVKCTCAVLAQIQRVDSVRLFSCQTEVAGEREIDSRREDENSHSDSQKDQDRKQQIFNTPR